MDSIREYLRSLLVSPAEAAEMTSQTAGGGMGDVRSMLTGDNSGVHPMDTLSSLSAMQPSPQAAPPTMNGVLQDVQDSANGNTDSPDHMAALMAHLKSSAPNMNNTPSQAPAPMPGGDMQSPDQNQVATLISQLQQSTGGGAGGNMPKMPTMPTGDASLPSGRQQEADQKQSFGDLLNRIQSYTQRDPEQEQHQNIMNFFGRLAAGKSPRFLSNLADATAGIPGDVAEQTKAAREKMAQSIKDEIELRNAQAMADYRNQSLAEEHARTVAMYGSPISPNAANLDPNAQPKFGVDLSDFSNLNPKQIKSRQDEALKIKNQADQAQPFIYDAQSALDTLRENLPDFKTGYAAGQRGTGMKIAALLGDKDAQNQATAYDNINTSAHAFVKAFSQINPGVGQRQSVALLNLMKDSKPGKDLTPDSAQDQTNTYDAALANLRIANEFRDYYVTHNPYHTLDGANELYDALLQKYPLTTRSNKRISFNSDNADKASEMIPDIISNPGKYGKTKFLGQPASSSVAVVPSAGVSVNAGNKTYSFPDQQSADAFKKAAGL